MKKAWLSLLAAGLALGLVAAACTTEETVVVPPPEAPTGIAVTGEGRVTVAPELALLNLGASAKALTAGEAMDQVSDAMERVFAVLRARGVAEEDIQTTQVSLFPEYEFRDDRQVFTGFRATNTVDVKVRDLESVGPIIDEVVKAAGDAVLVNNIAFVLEDPEEARAEARQEAIEDARDRAEALAEGAGVSLGDVTSISEGFVAIPQPVPFLRAAEANIGGEVPVSPGTLEVFVSVTVTFAIE